MILADAKSVNALVRAVHSQAMVDRGVQLDPETATALVRRQLDPDLRVRAVRRLHGGMVHRVYLLRTDGEPGQLVAKVNTADQAEHFHHEWQVMRWHEAHSPLPIPKPLALIDCPVAGVGSGLLMEYIDAPNLADARLSPAGFEAFQLQLAEHLAALHRLTRATYGSAIEPNGYARWIDVFGPMFERHFVAVRHHLASNTRWIIDELIRRLPGLLPESSKPVLVHGDLWATNILVDDRHPDHPRIRAFIDVGANYCEPEYELAYLTAFQTVGETFFERYQQHHTLRPGFEQRSRIYWLNTMLLHVQMFGDQYLPACVTLADQIKRIMR